MTKRGRFIIKIVFVALFLALAPLVIAYTLGYRYNFGIRQIQKTGVLIANTYPDDAEVWIDGKNTYRTTPAIIKKLNPKEYDVQITKQGYIPWGKKLEIRSGETTFADSVVLFYQDQPKPLVQREIIGSEFSPNGDKIIYAVEEASWNEIWLGALKKEKFTLIDRREIARLKRADFLWSGGSNRVYIEIQTQDNKEQLIYNVSKNDLQNLNQIFNNPIKNFKWSTTSDDIFYCLENNDLVSYSLLTGQKTFLLSKINEYYIRGDKIYTYRNDKDKTVIEQYDAADPAAKPQMLYQLSANSYQFEVASYPYLLLTDRDYNIFLYDMSKEFTDPIYKDQVKSFYWHTTSQGSKKLLLVKDFEIWIFDPETREGQLITRFGQPIKFSTWHRSGDYIFICFENSIKIIELDSRDKRNVFNLFEPQSLEDFNVDLASKNIYFIGLINNVYGLYRYSLIEEKK